VATPARRCTICATAAAPVIRFWLMKAATLPDGRPTTRGAGRIDLCQPCWATAQRQAERAGGKRRPRRAVA
jgi:hypothetical protein